MSSVEIRTRRIIDDPAFARLLDDGERERAERKRNPLPYIAAHALLRTSIVDRIGGNPRALAFEKRCPTCGTDRHGKPSIAGHPNLHISLSYTDRLAIVALTEAGEVGVDVEDLTESDFDGFDTVTLAKEEIAGFADYQGDDLLSARAQIWSRKEAVLKATGHGLVVDPTQVVVSGPRERAALLDWRAEQEPPGPVQVIDVHLADADHRGSVAVVAAGPVEIEDRLSG